MSLWKKILFFTPQGVAFLRFYERRFGPAWLPLLLTPVVFLDLLRRMVDYRAFQEVRRILPDTFWRGLSPARHYFRMIQGWQWTLAVGLLGDRLHLPEWQSRIRVIGTRPEQLPAHAHRPLILVYLHAGAYGVLHYWLRAQRLTATSYRAGLPRFLETAWAKKIFQQADEVQGLTAVPDMFRGARDLRPMLEFLRPGAVLAMALDADSTSLSAFNVNGHPIWLSQGVVHLAEASQAILLPVSLSWPGPGHLEIRFGEPVPDEMVKRRDAGPAIQYLLDQLWKEIEADPGRLGWSSLLTLDRRSNPNHLPWP